jgi:hypothetical protein
MKSLRDIVDDLIEVLGAARDRLCEQGLEQRGGNHDITSMIDEAISQATIDHEEEQ